MDVGEHRTDLRAEHSGQRHRMSLDGRHLHAHLAKRRRHLRSNEAQTHYHRAAPSPGLGTNPVAILDGAKLENAGKVAPWSGKSPVAPARGHEQTIVGNPLSALERNVLAPGIDRGGAHPEPEVDVPLGVERSRVDQLILEAILAAQVALGERGPAVGHPRLGPDHGYVALEAVLAQRGCRAASGQRGSNDDEPASLHRTHSDLEALTRSA
jgi:hypothetical protein